MIVDIARQESGRNESAVWSTGEKLSASGAAFVNSFCAGALDYDSLHPLGLVHPAICTVPAALAIGERVKASGREVLAAIAIADDLMCRMGLAHRSNRGWYFTALYGGIAASIVGARLLRLDAMGVESALGLAFIAASGTQIGIAERSLAKRLQTAQAAASGVRAALLAQLGYAGPSEIFDGKFGFYTMYEPGEGATLLRDLGTRYTNSEVIFKQYPNCGCSHAVLDGVIDLMVGQNIAPAQVQNVEVVISPYMHRLVGAPFDPAVNPDVVAQFSIQYAEAVAVLLRRFTLEELDPALVSDARICDLAKRVTVTVDPNNDGGVAPAEVQVTLLDGAVLRKVVTHLRGLSESPLAKDDLERKFVGCLTWRGRYEAREARSLFVRAQGVGTLSDVSAFPGSCAPRGAASSLQHLSHSTN